MSAHTPTPWEVYDGGQYIRTVAAGRCIAKLDWNIRDDVDAANAAFIVLACNSHGELVAALEKIIGGKCPECKGWGEVAYFGEMVACKCNGQYLPTPSHADIAKARATLAKAKGEAL